MSKIFSKIARNYCLHVCEFFHVWGEASLIEGLHLMMGIFIGTRSFSTSLAWIILAAVKYRRFNTLLPIVKTFLAFRQTWLSAMTLNSTGMKTSQVPQVQHNPDLGHKLWAWQRLCRATVWRVHQTCKTSLRSWKMRRSKIRPESWPNPANLTVSIMTYIF